MPEVVDRPDGAQETVQEQVQEKAQQATEQARGRLRDEVDTRSTELGQQVSGTSEAIREAAGQLREKGQDGPARATEQAAEKMEQAGRWLTESDADRILGDVEDFARRQPWAVLAGGIVAGFAASRFLKSSSSRRYGSREGSRSAGGSATGMARDLSAGNGLSEAGGGNGVSDVGGGNGVSEAGAVGTGGTPPADGGSVTH
jgi:hypothetical protein